jgi:hypothetical protein
MEAINESHGITNNIRQRLEQMPSMNHNFDQLIFQYASHNLIWDNWSGEGMFDRSPNLFAALKVLVLLYHHPAYIDSGALLFVNP